jgi:16S rRNA (guanine966-N2)-methyltransferase
VRVISGTARGRPLRATASTRPTADLIKGAIFSMLEALAYKRGFEPDQDGNLAAALAWPRVLDLFAGSGALGIEALSRGARSAEFIEQDRDAVRVIQANLRSTGLEDRARVHQAPVEVALRRVQAPIDLVLLDPPYEAAKALEAAVAALGGRVSAAIGPGIGRCCYEVGDEVAAAYRERFGRAVMRGTRLDLPGAAERALHAAGCASVERFDLCTACNPELFFSYRRDGAPRGGQGVVAYVA